MSIHQITKKQRAGGRLPLKKPLQRLNSDYLALPEDEIRKLIVLTTSRYKIEPFVRQLIKLMDDLKVDKTHNIGRLTKPGRDESRAILLAAIAKTVNDGRMMAAYHTAYQAALYAYENTLDHLLAFHDYLDYLRTEGIGRTLKFDGTKVTLLATPVLYLGAGRGT